MASAEGCLCHAWACSGLCWCPMAVIDAFGACSMQAASAKTPNKPAWKKVRLPAQRSHASTDSAAARCDACDGGHRLLLNSAHGTLLFT